MALGLFGGMRVLFDLIAAFLLAHGRSGRVLWIQICWCVVLVPALVLGAQTHGAAGAGWAHLAVGGLLVVPAYAVALSAEGLRVREMLAGLWRPTVACIPAALVGWLVALWVDDPWRALALGTAGGGLLYVGLTGSWLRRLVHNRADAGAAGAPVVSELGA
jgi:PST family polysaccharide transporter